MTIATMGSRALAELSADERALKHYEVMLEIRAFEERVLEMRLAEQIAGSVHLCIGQEAGPVGTCSALRPDDSVYATYRGHGWAIAAGAPLEGLFAELLGRETGVNAGRGGSAYLSHAGSHFMGENSIVGAGVPIAVGAALAARFQDSERVALTAFGDGATNQGAVHEALNMAAAFKLPVIFLCENNMYSELTPIADMVGEPELYRRAAAYGMDARRVDGNDPEAVFEAVSRAAERARSGDGPTFIESLTYRLCGHYIGDAQTYRTLDDVERARANGPLVRMKSGLAARGIREGTLNTIETDVGRRVAAAAETALDAPLADIRTVMEHLYA